MVNFLEEKKRPPAAIQLPSPIQSLNQKSWPPRVLVDKNIEMSSWVLIEVSHPGGSIKKVHKSGFAWIFFRQAAKFGQIRFARRTLKLLKSPRGFSAVLLCTLEHAGPYKLQGGAETTRLLGKSQAACRYIQDASLVFACLQLWFHGLLHKALLQLRTPYWAVWRTIAPSSWFMIPWSLCENQSLGSSSAKNLRKVSLFADMQIWNAPKLLIQTKIPFARKTRHPLQHKSKTNNHWNLTYLILVYLACHWKILCAQQKKIHSGSFTSPLPTGARCTPKKFNMDTQNDGL